MKFIDSDVAVFRPFSPLNAGGGLRQIDKGRAGANNGNSSYLVGKTRESTVRP